MDNKFILMDRLQKIQQIIRKYGEENFYISYSGGKDSNVLSALIDMALPDNRIPRVYCNTGIEYKAIVDFVKAKAAADDRFVIIQPKVPIKRMLEEKGYPFKSKAHSRWLGDYQTKPYTKSWQKYMDGTLFKTKAESNCPKRLKYQFSKDFDIKISDQCCHELKVTPLKEYEKASGRAYAIIGIMPEEGGRRQSAKCLTFKHKKEHDFTLKAFQPLVPLTKSWEDWFISEYKIDLSVLYYPPYNFERTGCKGCPFAQNLQHELDILKTMFPAEYKQCEYIWKPVYDEYRRLGYRLRKVDENQISFFD